MITQDGNKVKTCDGIILWDGITQPDTDDRTGATVHNISVAIPQNAPEYSELHQLATKKLNEGEFKGNLPPNANWPLRDIDMSKYGDSASLLQGHVRFSAKTRAGVPQVFDTNGNQLTAMQFGQMLYPGCKVQVLVHVYDYNGPQKGIAFGLDGIMITDHTAPKLDVGGGASAAEVADAFGFNGGGSQTAQPAAPAASSSGATPPPPAPGNDFAGDAGAATPPPPTPGPQMTDKANGIPYEQWIQQGWTDELLIQHGYVAQ